MEKKVKKNYPKNTNYLGLSFQMGIFIFLATYGGMKLDEYLEVKYLFVILFSLLSIFLSLYYIVHKELHNKKK